MNEALFKLAALNLALLLILFENIVKIGLVRAFDSLLSWPSKWWRNQRQLRLSPACFWSWSLSSVCHPACSGWMWTGSQWQDRRSRNCWSGHPNSDSSKIIARKSPNENWKPLSQETFAWLGWNFDWSLAKSKNIPSSLWLEDVSNTYLWLGLFQITRGL